MRARRARRERPPPPRARARHRVRPPGRHRREGDRPAAAQRALLVDRRARARRRPSWSSTPRPAAPATRSTTPPATRSTAAPSAVEAVARRKRAARAIDEMLGAAREGDPLARARRAGREDRLAAARGRAAPRRQERAGLPRVRPRAARRSDARLHPLRRPADPPRTTRSSSPTSSSCSSRRCSHDADVTAGLAADGIVVANSAGASRRARSASPPPQLAPARSVNLVMLGALAAALGEPPLDDLVAAAVEVLGKKADPEELRAALEAGPRSTRSREAHERPEALVRADHRRRRRPRRRRAARSPAAGAPASSPRSTWPSASTACSAGSTAPTRRSSSTGRGSPASTTTTARAARSAPRCARRTRSRWWRSRMPDAARDDRRRGGRPRDAADRPGRRPGLPDHAADADHPGLREVRRRRARRLGDRQRRVRALGDERRDRLRPRRRPDDHRHLLAGPRADGRGRLHRRRDARADRDGARQPRALRPDQHPLRPLRLDADPRLRRRSSSSPRTRRRPTT